MSPPPGLGPLLTRRSLPCSWLKPQLSFRDGGSKYDDSTQDAELYLDFKGEGKTEGRKIDPLSAQQIFLFSS